MIFDSIIGPERPVTWVFRFWPVLAVSFAGSLAATWLCKKIAIRFGIVDKPDDLVKTHKEPVAYLGGLGILAGLCGGILVSIYFLGDMQLSREMIKWLLGIVAGAIIACFVGLVDDIFNLKPGQKMLGQIFAAMILVFVGILPNLYFINYLFGITIPTNIEIVLSVLVVVFFVLGATNSLNLLDGLDGLCAGVTGIITMGMLVLSIHLATWATNGLDDPNDHVRLIVCVALVGGVFGFLPFNRYPAKIFMGDAGSMLLGFIMAAIMILFARGAVRWWMASIVVFGLPILDTAVAMVRRLVNHRPLFVSDRGHIYDQLIDRGVPLKKTVRTFYALAGVYVFIGLAMSQVRTRYAGVVYILVVVISAFIVWKKGFLKMEGLRGAIRKKN